VEKFVAAPHELALRMRLNEGAAGGEFFEVADGGARHRGRLSASNVRTNLNDPEAEGLLRTSTRPTLDVLLLLRAFV